MSVFKWRDEEAMWSDVNGVDFGLTGYVWVNNASRHFMGAPFSGVKQSGIGHEECFAELLEFPYTKNVNLKLG